ncbi:peroxisomal 2,4-dienoyl-CoA reductase [(3E)-enoyl-CoA-producing] isoform X2 [Sminthopsis crassicaudata]|uniref:peroxisomal 2,4-dienoyl-CoA reductase [(3E)-enoyl-CoA-producing] isoform X2 n=1 Tax=Sminthopsis crassicaudata TaxID=9301 RepID=UPI003D694544
MSHPPPDVSTDDCLRSYSYLFCPDILRDKVAFITGGGSGIGFRIAEIFMRHGCHTVIASRNQEKVSDAAKKLVAATGQQCLALSLDVREPQTITAAIDKALKKFGKIDILINGAAGNFLCAASSLSFNAYKTVIDIDTIGTFNVSKIMFEKYFQDHGGVIINITATLDYRGQVFQVHAGTAKAAVAVVEDRYYKYYHPHGTNEGTESGRLSDLPILLQLRSIKDAMTRHLAVEWGHNNIRVNSLAPGPISGTEGMRRLGVHQPNWDRNVLRSPLQRLGNKTEIAHAALFLASPLASYVTGTVLVVDGGSWLTNANDYMKLLGIDTYYPSKL